MGQTETQLNTQSSCMESGQSPSVLDVLTGLFNRDRVDEMIDIQMDAISLAVIHDIDILEVLNLSIDDFVKLYEPPKQVQLPKVPGRWDRVIYGEAVFKEEN